VIKDQVHVLSVAASREIKMLSLTKSIKECRKSWDGVSHLESDLQMLLTHHPSLSKPVNKIKWVCGRVSQHGRCYEGWTK